MRSVVRTGNRIVLIVSFFTVLCYGRIGLSQSHVRPPETVATPRLVLEGQAEMVTLAFGPDGRRLVAASSDKTLSVWDPATGKRLKTLRGFTECFVHLAFGPDGRTIAGAFGTGSDSFVFLDGATYEQLQSVCSPDTACVAYSADGRTVVTGPWPALWDVATRTKLKAFKGDVHHADQVALSPDGHELVAGLVYGNAIVWNVETGKIVRTYRGDEGYVFSVAYSPDGKKILLGSSEEAILWDAASDKRLATLKGHKDWVWSVAFSPDGRRMLTGSHDGNAIVWDSETMEQLTILKAGAPISSVAFSPDGQGIATTSGTRILLWDCPGTDDKGR